MAYVVKVLFCVVWTMQAIDGATFTDMNTLYSTLTTGYNKFVRPKVNFNEATNISLAFTLLNLQDIDEVNGVMSVAGYFTVSWRDEKMVWTPSAHNNVKVIAIPYDILWWPPLMNTNSAKEFKFFGLTNTYVQVNNDGTILWLPGENLEFLCDIDTSYFPFDIQTCEFVVKVWGLPCDEIMFSLTNTTINTDLYQSNAVWELIETLVYSDANDVPNLKFKMNYKRRPMFLMTTLVMPAVFLAVLNLCVFLLPQDSGERIGFAITLLLSVVVFMTIAQDLLPSTAVPRLSAICIMLLIDMVMSGMITVSVIVSARLYYKTEDEEIPKWIQTVIQFKLSKANKVHAMRIKEKDAISQSGSDSGYNGDITWKKVASFFDTVSLVFYIVCFIGGSLGFFMDIAFGSSSM